jgi:predicted nicotinamide N-methyase
MTFPIQLQTFLVGDRRIKIFVPDADAVKTAYESGRISFPYWSKVWPAAIGLSSFLLMHPHCIQNKTVVEAGAGLGLPSVITANLAKHVLCTDVVAAATEIAGRSAAHNGLKNFSTAVMDWHALPEDLHPDLLLLSDVNYEPAAFDALLKMIEKVLAQSVTVILSTPQRLVAKDFVAPLARFCKAKAEVMVQEVAITVMVLEQEP